jgi:hypothetical protein
MFISGVVDTGDKFLVFWLFMTGINDTGKNVIAGVFDTADKHSFAAISANFRKKSKRS